MSKFLIVEDEIKIAAVLRDYLEREGFDVQYLAEGTHAVEHIRRGGFACVLLDVMLPGRDGLDICRSVRTFSDVPIIMLTARVDEIDRLLGLELGADDYVCKPFSPREVVARARAILRRIERKDVTASNASQIRYGDLELNIERYSCTACGNLVDLTPVEFRLLAKLAEKPGLVFSRAKLMEGAYDDHRIVSDRTIDSHIKNLRRKLNIAGCSNELIRSIYGVGYKLE